MAYTSSIVSVSGTGPYAIGFNYRAGDTIKVSPVIGFTFAGTPTQEQPSGTTIVLDTIPEAATLLIYKDIKLDELVVDWQIGSQLDLSNLRNMSLNLMEQAQAAYDMAFKADGNATEALLAVSTVITDATVLVAQATAQAELSQYWAEIALEGAGVANPSGVAEAARDAAIAAKNLAVAARIAAEAARDIAVANALTSTANAASALASKNLAEAYATNNKGVAVVSGKFSAKHYAETAQDIVNAGAQKWNGSAKFVSLLPPTSLDGVDGDFWFERAST